MTLRLYTLRKFSLLETEPCNQSINQSINQSKSSVKTLLRLSSLIAIVSFVGCISQAQAAVCTTAAPPLTNWSAATWTGCSTSPPSATDDVVIATNVIMLDQDATVKSITINSGVNLTSLANFFLTLTATIPASSATGILASRVKLSDANHTINDSINFSGLQWATPLTAPRTLTINGTIKLSGGGFNLDGTAANPVTFAGTGNFFSAVTVNNCAGKPATMTNLTCNSPVVNNPVSAPIGISLDTKPVIFSKEVVR